MPQIQEYLSQTEAQGPTGGTSPNIELAGSVGRSIERIGGAITEGGEYIRRRDAQEETANVYADMAEKKAQWGETLNAQIQDGTLDIDKFKEGFDADTAKLAENISTREGQNAFQRQQARIKTSLLHTAVLGKAQIAARDAQGRLQKFVASQSASVMTNPADFEETYQTGVDFVDDQIATGGLPAKYREKAIQEMGSEYAKAMIDGLSKSDTDKAREVLDKGGLIDELLGADGKRWAYGRVEMQERANEANEAKMDRDVERARKAEVRAWEQKNFAALEKGELPPSEVINAVTKGTLTAEEGHRLIGWIDKDAKRGMKTDNRVYNQLVSRITLGSDPSNPMPNAIYSVDELKPYVGHGITIADYNRLGHFLTSGETGQQNKMAFKMLMDAAKGTIRYKNPMTNQYDANGEGRLAQFTADYKAARDELVKQNLNPNELLDPKSKLYFGSPENLAKYATPLNEQLNGIHQERSDKALGIKPDPNKPDQKQKPANAQVRKPNETAAQYLKRMGLGG